MLGFLFGCFLHAGAQDTSVEPVEAADPILLEIDSIFAEELKQVSSEWKASFFTEENAGIIKAGVRKLLGMDAEKMPLDSRKVLIRKTVRDAFFFSMRNAVLKSAEAFLLEHIGKLPDDWRDEALKGENMGKMLQEAAGGMDLNFLNLPKKERDAALSAKVKDEIVSFQRGVTLSDAERIFVDAFNKWPDALKTKVDEAQKQFAVKLLIDSVSKKSSPEMQRKDINGIIAKEVSIILLRLAEKLVEAEMMDVIARETGGMGPGLTEALIIDEKAFKELIAETKKTVFSSMSAASAETDPLLFYKKAAEKIPGVVQTFLLRERDKYRGICLKKALPEEVAFNQEKSWLLHPVSDAPSKENTMFPYVDESYHLCKAVAESDLSHCDKITGEGREGHKEDCQSFALLYLKAMPVIIEQGAYPDAVMNEILALKASKNAEKDAVEPVLRAFAEKNTARCEPLKEKHGDTYRICQSAIKRDVKACAAAALPVACEQVALSFEALLYNDDSKLNKIPYDEIVMPTVLLSRLQFNKNTCSEFYDEAVKKRACYNLYMYKPFKEVKKDEEEKEQKKK